MQNFVLVLAWIFTPVALVVVLFKAWCQSAYDRGSTLSMRIMKLEDALKDSVRVWKQGLWPYIFIFGLAYLISHYFVK